MHNDLSPSTVPGAPVGLPLLPLVTLAIAVFLGIVSETLPAGLLPELAAGLGVPEAAAGALVSVYAIGSLAAAIPLTAATRHLPRRPLVVTAMSLLATASIVTAVADTLPLALVARFVGGVGAGLLWSLTAGYAMRLAAPEHKGRALAVAMTGIPLSMAVGVPAAAWLGQLSGWRTAFVVLGIAGLLVAAVLSVVLPPLAGERATSDATLGSVLRLPALRVVLAVTGTFVLAHNLMYTYIAPVLTDSGAAVELTVVLFVFGVASVVSVWVVGRSVDRHMRQVVIVASAALVTSLGLLALAGASVGVFVGGVALWALAFGGSATFLQAAAANVAGTNADVAQSMIVTVWNLAIAGGAAIGGVLLDRSGADAVPWAALAFATAALALGVLRGNAAFGPLRSARRVAPAAAAADATPPSVSARS